jgi:hypothetical protein
LLLSNFDLKAVCIVKDNTPNTNLLQKQHYGGPRLPKFRTSPVRPMSMS